MSSMASAQSTAFDDLQQDVETHRHTASGAINAPETRHSGLSLLRRFHDWRGPAACEGAGDRELARLTGRLGRLQAEDVRWDLIGMACSGRRYRT